MPVKPFNVVRGILISVLSACAAACSQGPLKDEYRPELAPPSISVSLPDGRSTFQVDEDIAVNIDVSIPEGQSDLFGSVSVQIKKNGSIEKDMFAQYQPSPGDEQVKHYLSNFAMGMAKPGKYEVVSRGAMRLPKGIEPKNPGQPFHYIDSNVVAIEVTK